MAITKNSQIDLNGNEMILDADGDTTITADTDDQIDFKTAGSDRVTINSSGKVGIGTSNPAAELHVKKNDAGFEVDIDSQVTDGVRLLAYDRDASTDRPMQYRASQQIFYIGSSEAMRIDSSGNVGIGQSSPNDETNRVSLELNDTWGGVFQNSVSGTPKSEWRWSTGGATFFGSVVNEPLAFQTNGSERMRIDSNGVNIGATTIFSGSTELEVQYGITVKHSTTIGQARNIYMDDNAGALKYYNGYNVASLSNAGSWTNASDIAYKENIVDTEHGLDVVKLLQPRDYTLKSDSSSQTGFIAQELETHLPQFVEGDEGEKGVNYGQLTAVLTKAIQEQQEQIEALQSEINTLKGG